MLTKTLLIIAALITCDVYSFSIVHEHLRSWFSLSPQDATFLIVVEIFLSAFLGIKLSKKEIFLLFDNLQRGKIDHQQPMGMLAEGFLISLGGFALVIPGFFSDLIGLTLLIPPIRKGLMRSSPTGGSFGKDSFHSNQQQRSYRIHVDNIPFGNQKAKPKGEKKVEIQNEQVIDIEAIDHSVKRP